MLKWLRNLLTSRAELVKERDMLHVAALALHENLETSQQRSRETVSDLVKHLAAVLLTSGGSVVVPANIMDLVEEDPSLGVDVKRVDGGTSYTVCARTDSDEESK